MPGDRHVRKASRLLHCRAYKIAQERIARAGYAFRDLPGLRHQQVANDGQPVESLHDLRENNAGYVGSLEPNAESLKRQLIHAERIGDEDQVLDRDVDFIELHRREVAPAHTCDARKLSDREVPCDACFSKHLAVHAEVNDKSRATKVQEFSVPKVTKIYRTGGKWSHLAVEHVR